MERLGGKLRPVDCKVEDHKHIFRHCFFNMFMFDTVHRAFGGSGGGVGPCGAQPPVTPSPPCISYALVQATVGVGTVTILYVI